MIFTEIFTEIVLQRFEGHFEAIRLLRILLQENEAVFTLGYIFRIFIERVDLVATCDHTCHYNDSLKPFLIDILVS